MTCIACITSNNQISGLWWKRSLVQEEEYRRVLLSGIPMSEIIWPWNIQYKFKLYSKERTLAKTKKRKMLLLKLLAKQRMKRSFENRPSYTLAHMTKSGLGLSKARIWGAAKCKRIIGRTWKKYQQVSKCVTNCELSVNSSVVCMKMISSIKRHLHEVLSVKGDRKSKHRQRHNTPRIWY